MPVPDGDLSIVCPVVASIFVALPLVVLAIIMKIRNKIKKKVRQSTGLNVMGPAGLMIRLISLFLQSNTDQDLSAMEEKTVTIIDKNNISKPLQNEDKWLNNNEKLNDKESEEKDTASKEKDTDTKEKEKETNEKNADIEKQDSQTKIKESSHQDDMSTKNNVPFVGDLRYVVGIDLDHVADQSRDAEAGRSAESENSCLDKAENGGKIDTIQRENQDGDTRGYVNSEAWKSTHSVNEDEMGKINKAFQGESTRI